MSRLQTLLRSLTRDDQDATWRPVLLRCDSEADRAALEDLVDRGEILRAVDTLAAQVDELCATRLPGKGQDAERRRLREQLVGPGGEERYGVWAFYPWSGRAVRLLPSSEFWELRTSRNRYKITLEEQRRLASLKIAIVGLSVGHATALTLALEGIGGELRLADFDTLSLSNLNRLRTGVHHLGVNKAVFTAREIFELNPYARIELHRGGVSYETVDELLTSDGGIDLLIEECDDLAMKVFLRERARALRIPVLMETSDRGLLDIERFDLEPQRPLLHGLIEDTDSTALRGLTTDEKVPFVLDILGAETVSTRFAATLVEIDRTVPTWPQLASAVALGGALNADSARRIALGQLEASGRFYVDLERVISSDTAAHALPAAAGRRSPTQEAPLADWANPSSARVERRGQIGDQVVRAARSAPSGGNAQPWLFETAPGGLRGFVDPSRARTFLDFEGSAAAFALGAAAENARLKAQALASEVELLSTSTPDGPAFALEWSETAGPHPTPLAGAIEARATNRRIGRRRALPASAVRLLQQVAEDGGARLQLVQEASALTSVGAVIGGGERFRLLHPDLHRELCGELRWTDEEAEATGDGIHVRSLELSTVDEAGLRVSRRPDAMAFLRELSLGDRLAEAAYRAVTTAGAFAALWVPADGPLPYFEAGRVAERLWLTAELLGISVQPMTALPYLFARLDAGAVGLRPEDAASLDGLRMRLGEVMPTRRGEVQTFLFRLAVLPAPSLRAQRRPLATLVRRSAAERRARAVSEMVWH